ncbi:hypothetical protein P3S68_032819 [Capsicum galapagoense]
MAIGNLSKEVATTQERQGANDPTEGPFSGNQHRKTTRSLKRCSRHLHQSRSLENRTKLRTCWQKWDTTPWSLTCQLFCLPSPPLPFCSGSS